MSKTDLSAEIAAASPTLAIHVPVAVYLNEALDVAKFATEHWDAVKDGARVALPGLASIAHKKTAGYAVSAHTSDEIRTLVERARAAQTDVHLAETPHASREDVERAAHVVSEIEASLEFLFDDGKQDANDDKLAAVQQAHAHDGSIAGLAQALDDYAALGVAHRKDLDGLGDFDAALLDEAPKLAARLRARAPEHAPSPAASAAMEKRNRILNALDARVSAVRSAARFVFRKHPDVQRRATSAYERRKRAASRRAAAAKQAQAPAS